MPTGGKANLRLRVERQPLASLAARLPLATTTIAALTLAFSTLCFLLAAISPQVGQVAQQWFSNSPHLVTEELWLWQPLTANFVHSGIIHLGVNLFFVMWLGPPLEELLGSRRFALFYVGAGVFAYAAFDLSADVFGRWGQTSGSSGCVLAVAALSALCFPKRPVYFYGVVRFPLWWLVLLLVISDLSSLLLGDGIPSINNVVHLGGVAFAVAYWFLLMPRTVRSSCSSRCPKAIDRTNSQPESQDTRRQ